MALDQIFRSSEKSKKIRSTDYETFDQLKKHNFDQVNFGQTTPSPLRTRVPQIKILSHCSDKWQEWAYFQIILYYSVPQDDNRYNRVLPKDEV